jgi:hypothetical protein
VRIDLKPTGSAAQDTANLKAASEALSFPIGAYGIPFGVLGLSGEYYTTEAPLQLGGNAKTTPAIDGGNSCINYVGPKTDQPVVQFGLPGHSPGIAHCCLMRDLIVNANRKARGVRFQQHPYHNLAENLCVYAARQVAVDAIDCWGAYMRGITAWLTHGISLRLVGSGVFRCDGLLRVYSYPDDFPPADDQTTKRYNGSLVQTPEANRAAIVIAGNKTTLASVCLESMKFGALPLIYSWAGNVIEQAHFEANECTNAYIVVDGSNEVWGGRGFLVRNFTSAAAVKCRSFVELRGRTYDVRVTDGLFNGLDKHIIYAANGQHFGATVKRCGSFNNAIPDDQWIGVASGATVQAEVPEQMTQQAPPPPPVVLEPNQTRSD